MPGPKGAADPLPPSCSFLHTYTSLAETMPSPLSNCPNVLISPPKHFLASPSILSEATLYCTLHQIIFLDHPKLLLLYDISVVSQGQGPTCPYPGHQLFPISLYSLTSFTNFSGLFSKVPNCFCCKASIPVSHLLSCDLCSHMDSQISLLYKCPKVSTSELNNNIPGGFLVWEAVGTTMPRRRCPCPSAWSFSLQCSGPLDTGGSHVKKERLRILDAVRVRTTQAQKESN